jgi:hypothetical protein
MARKKTCTKCGGGDIHVRWFQQAHFSRGYRECRNLEEHLHHFCRGCGYEWDTECLDAAGKGE